MKSKIINVIISVSILISISVQVDAQTYKKELKSGEKAFKEGRYQDAADFYNNATLMIKVPGKEHLNLFYKLGYCEMRVGEYKKANTDYLKYLSLAKKYPVSEKQLAQVKEWNDWVEAEIKTDEEEIRTENIKPEIEIANVKEVNSALNDYGAIFVEDNRILFTTNRQNEFDKDLININDDIYVVYYDKGTYSEPFRVKTAFNTKYEDMASSFCAATNTMYLSLSSDDHKTCDIYSSVKDRNNWSDPVKLTGGVNSDAWDGYPSISSDGKTLYFSSDRGGGVGGKDIYISTLQSDGSWSEARNIGRSINTRMDEITPHIDSLGERLYYSSNSSEGFGGFDIYYADYEASALWGIAVNMGLPINSIGNDIFYVTTNEADLAFFSSNRKGGAGIYDIYTAKTKEIKPEDVAVQEKEPVDVEIRPGITEENIVKTNVDEPTKEPETKTTTTTTTPSSTGAKLTAAEMYNAQISGLHFKVQIGAFRNHITVNHPYFTERMDPKEITEEQMPPDNLYKYTVGMYYTITSATEYKMQIRAKGYADAFLTCYYNNNRISMDEAKEIIRNNFNNGKVSVTKFKTEK